MSFPPFSPSVCPAISNLRQTPGLGICLRPTLKQSILGDIDTKNHSDDSTFLVPDSIFSSPCPIISPVTASITGTNWKEKEETGKELWNGEWEVGVPSVYNLFEKVLQKEVETQSDNKELMQLKELLQIIDIYENVLKFWKSCFHVAYYGNTIV